MPEKRIGEAANDAERALETLLSQVEPWRDEEIRYRPVHGGFSNSNWRLVVGDCADSYFLKIPGNGTEMFIDRSAAAEASRRAYALGIGPRTYDYLSHHGVEIADFVEGRRACTIRDFTSAEVRAQSVSVYRKFNNSGALSLTKTIFDMIEEHFDQVRALDGALPADFAWLNEQYRLARSALEADGLDIVPCYNDPMPANFLIGEDSSILLVDYEYASNNDRCYELAIWCNEMFFSDQIENEVIEAYFGRVDPRIRARMYLFRMLADLKWATWAMVQNSISKLDFDFYKFGAWKHMRARSTILDPRWSLSLGHLKAFKS